jgi:hypothetical protein
MERNQQYEDKAVLMRLQVGDKIFAETKNLPRTQRKLFRPGDLVPTSGVYAVLHSTPHRLIEHEWYIEGGRFLCCRACPLGVWYRLQEECIPVSSGGWTVRGELAVG